MFRKTLSLAKFVELNISGQISHLKLNNFAKRNALCSTMIQELTDGVDQISKSKTHIVVLSSTGSVFSSGHDLKEMKSLNHEEQKKILMASCNLFSKLRNMNQIVIAQVNGIVAAAGLQLVSTCDLVICTKESQFSTSGVKFGLFCHTPAVPVIRSMTSSKKAFEMLVTGDSISATDALQYGLVNQVVDADNLEKATTEMCNRITKNSRSVLGLGKKVFYKQKELDESLAYTVAMDAMMENLQMEDTKEGFNAFAEKRTPKWKI